MPRRMSRQRSGCLLDGESSERPGLDDWREQDSLHENRGGRRGNTSRTRKFSTTIRATEKAPDVAHRATPPGSKRTTPRSPADRRDRAAVRAGAPGASLRSDCDRQAEEPPHCGQVVTADVSVGGRPRACRGSHGSELLPSLPTRESKRESDDVTGQGARLFRDIGTADS